MTGELEKLDKNADVTRMSPEALWYDDAILHYRYHKLAEGQKYEGWMAEDMVNLHVRIVQELKRRGLRHFDRDDELDGDSKPFLKDYADVRPSGTRLGEPVSLDDVLPHLRTFKLRQPYVYLVGGLVAHGKTEGDVDVLIKDSEALPPEFRHVLEWRIMRALPEKLWDRVQFHYDHFHGPFTDNVPIFDLTVERANEENQVFRMGAEPGDLVKGMPREEAVSFLKWADEKESREPRAGTPEVARQAEDSRREDRVELFRFFVPMKPVRGYFPEAGPADADVEKSNYLGSKRRLAKFIVDKFAEDARTVFDPMCGVSGVLVEAARRGYRVRGNDLSIVPYWYSKGVFEGAPLSDADV